LLPGFLDEPLLLSRDAAGTLRCLSNVCTHRGNILVNAPCRAKQIRCGYHSRRFELDGRMTFMPEFKEAKDFPRPEDDLPRLALQEWGGQAFVTLDTSVPFDAFLGEALASVADDPVGQLTHDSSRDRSFDVHANWAL